MNYQELICYLVLWVGLVLQGRSATQRWKLQDDYNKEISGILIALVKKLKNDAIDKIMDEK